MAIITVQNLDKFYVTGKVVVAALVGINLEIKKGEMVAIMGPSGSGKSTLMHIIGLLDRPTAGGVKIKGQLVDLDLPDRHLARLRRENIGFVFQSFNLLPRLSALANVLVPTTYQKVSRSKARERAKTLLTRVGLADRLEHKPNQLSGGELQRVAIARALINDPEIILADEPTGNLDSKSGQEVMRLIGELHRGGKTVVIVTHNQDVARACQRTIRFFDGRVASDD